MSTTESETIWTKEIVKEVGSKVRSTIKYFPITLHNALVGSVAKLTNSTVALWAKGINVVTQTVHSLWSILGTTALESIKWSRHGLKDTSDKWYNLVQKTPILKDIPIVKNIVWTWAAWFGGIGGAITEGIGITGQKWLIWWIKKANKKRKDIASKYKSYRAKINNIRDEKSSRFKDQYKNNKISPLFYTSNTIWGTAHMVWASVGIGDWWSSTSSHASAPKETKTIPISADHNDEWEHKEAA